MSKIIIQDLLKSSLKVKTKRVVRLLMWKPPDISWTFPYFLRDTHDKINMLIPLLVAFELTFFGFICSRSLCLFLAH